MIDTRELYLRFMRGDYAPLETLVCYMDLVAMTLVDNEPDELWSLLDQGDERNLPVTILNKVDDMFRLFRDHVNELYVHRLPFIKGNMTPFKVTTHEAYLKFVE